jgi:hypothetical protein
MHPHTFIPAAFPTAQAVAPVAARTLGMLTAMRIATAADACGCIEPRRGARPARRDWYRGTRPSAPFASAVQVSAAVLSPSATSATSPAAAP